MCVFHRGEKNYRIAVHHPYLPGDITNPHPKSQPQKNQKSGSNHKKPKNAIYLYKPFELKKHKNSPFKLKDSARILPKTTSKQL